MAIETFEAAGGAGEGVQLSRRTLERRREIADENKIRRCACGCAVQWNWNMATQSSCALDDDAGRREGAWRGSETITCEHRTIRETGREISLLGLHVDEIGDDGSCRGVRKAISGFQTGTCVESIKAGRACRTANLDLAPGFGREWHVYRGVEKE